MDHISHKVHLSKVLEVALKTPLKMKVGIKPLELLLKLLKTA